MGSLTATHNGVDLLAGLDEVYTASGGVVLREGCFRFNVGPSPVSPLATWNTHYHIRVGVHEQDGADWVYYFQVTYGSDLSDKPYFSRQTVTVQLPGQTLDLDQVASADVVGACQGIPCSVVNWDATADSITSVEENRTLAFTETKRIRAIPSNTGFADDGEFGLSYDHTVEGEGRETFYAAACWPDKFLATDGRSFRRGDLIDRGSVLGFCTGERGPFAHESTVNATNYHIAHAKPTEPWRDARVFWRSSGDPTWADLAMPARAESGLMPFVGNLKSRGADALYDFGMAWILKAASASNLTRLPSPVSNHSRNRSFANYDEDAMRSKGRVAWALLLLWEGSLLLQQRRTNDVELNLQAVELEKRFTEVLELLKRDFDNGSAIEFREGFYYGWWELGHYCQFLIYYQQVVFDLLGRTDAKVTEMLRSFTARIIDETLYWKGAGTPHPRDPSATITATAVGWFLEYRQNTRDPKNSAPTTGIGPSLIGVYQWASAHGVRPGNKLRDIIDQYAFVDDKWKYVPRSPNGPSFGINAELNGKTQGFLILRAANGLSADLVSVGTLTASLRTLNPSLIEADLVSTGGGTAALRTASDPPRSDPRDGADIILCGTREGADIQLGPMVTRDFEFPVVRGDDYAQPFPVKLSGGRSLDGTESFRATMKLTKGGEALATFSSPLTITVTDQKLRLIFDENTLPVAKFPLSEEDTAYWIDIEMTKAGKETLGIGKAIVISDLST